MRIVEPVHRDHVHQCVYKRQDAEEFKLSKDDGEIRLPIQPGGKLDRGEMQPHEFSFRQHRDAEIVEFTADRGTGSGPVERSVYCALDRELRAGIRLEHSFLARLRLILWIRSRIRLIDYTCLVKVPEVPTLKDLLASDGRADVFNVVHCMCQRHHLRYPT